jgi:hypothetical protein
MRTLLEIDRVVRAGMFAGILHAIAAAGRALVLVPGES